ncbi:preprotein translocase subunit YajC [Lignipirellula cremea]|uniref:Sec translocon accessory complex subunit YajC n=1 Tax=Lignipirellula cremea TaxID=2528010 RepID=A0A518E4R3_9BACT|nr:preprotein translocase subunit YajC [Lignipirellula cremea]QDU99072.1 preprotein translocase subunit YajC [Lignipirellula cremea]
MFLLEAIPGIVSSSLASSAAIFAQAGEAAGGAGGAGGAAGAGDGGLFGSYGMLLPLLVMGVAWYFLLIRPEGRRRSEQAAMLSQIKKNDRVLTASGIFGVVVNAQKKFVTLRIDENNNTRIKVLRSAISSVLSEEDVNEPAESGAAKE